jgi:hypothetical protein
MSTLEEIKEMVAQYQDSQVLFDEPIIIKSSPHRLLFTCYGVWSGDKGIFLMDEDEIWHGPLLESDINGSLVIGSLYQRMKILTSDLRKAV